MNFKEIIKQEWEKEFPNNECPYEDSLFLQYGKMVDRICVRVHNAAIQSCIENIELEGDEGDEVWINKDSILKLKINEQGTDTTEV